MIQSHQFECSFSIRADGNPVPSFVPCVRVVISILFGRQDGNGQIGKYRRQLQFSPMNHSLSKYIPEYAPVESRRFEARTAPKASDRRKAKIVCQPRSKNQEQVFAMLPGETDTVVFVRTRKF